MHCGVHARASLWRPHALTVRAPLLCAQVENGRLEEEKKAAALAADTAEVRARAHK